MKPHYFYQNNQYYQYPYYPSSSYRQYQTVDPSKFMSSAKNMEKLMKDASLLLAKMAGSRPFSFDLMNAAQASDHKKIENMIKSTGITLTPVIKYSPDGLYLHFEAGEQYADCCSLTLKLRWT